jgi:hypothetical protein
MTIPENRLVTKIRQMLLERLQNGQMVDAIKFYREVTLTPLLESKQFVEAFQVNNETPVVDKRFEPFLNFLEDRDFGGAAAWLCAEQHAPNDAIAITIHIARMLEVDVSALELPASIGTTLSESSHAQTIVNERAIELVNQRLTRNLINSGMSQEEAEKLLRKWNPESSHSPQSEPIAFEGVDPQLTRVVRLFQAPIPLPSKTLTIASTTATTSSTLLPKEATRADQRQRWFRSVGMLAALVYLLLATAGIAMVGYSYSAIPKLTPFAMSEGLSPTEQRSKIDEWANQSLPKTLPWFISSVQDQFFPVRLEPDLPLVYAGEEWTWEKKIVSVNSSTDEIFGRLKRYHEMLLVLYGIAIIVAVFHSFNLDIVSGILMSLMGVLGIPFLSAQIWRLEFNSLPWLGPLLIPGLIALIASILDLALIAPKTNRRKELRGFWFGTFLFVGAGLALGWAITEGNHLKSGAGLGVFGGAWLMLRHGWRYVRSGNIASQAEPGATSRAERLL